MRRPTLCAPWIAGAIGMLMALPHGAAAQEWRATVQAGRVSYGSTPVDGGDNAGIVVGVNRAARTEWLGLSAAVPIGTDPFWAVLSGWKRAETRGAAGLLLDLTGHGFIQRQTVSPSIPGGGTPLPGGTPTTTGSRVNGIGGGLDARAGAFVHTPRVLFEVRGGAAAQRSEQGGAIQGRLLPAADARVSIVGAPFVVSAESRAWWRGAERPAYAGGTLQLARGPLQLWGSAGQWVSGGVPGVVWAAGGRAGISPRIDLLAAARANSFDPLYRTLSATTFSIGISARIGGRGAFVAPVAARRRDGLTVIRLADRDAGVAPSIAGDFTGWKPMPMQRDGGHWVYVVRLVPGAYHYAFVSAAGTWFVPRSVPGRQDDGMGGQTAVLVVPA